MNEMYNGTFSVNKEKQFKTFSMELGGRTLSVDIGRVSAQANGAAFMHYGDTTVLSTATASDKPRDGIDFFPLSVEYEEKLYAVGKIPGGFNKREGKASENAILTSRVIDRPMRPLFPKDYRNDVTLNNMVMSVDPQCRPELVAMLGSAIATAISDIPFDGPCATTQLGMVDGEFIVNPSQEQWKNGDLQLTVASTSTKVIMIEAGANEIPEAKMIEAIYKCHEINQTIIEFINKMAIRASWGQVVKYKATRYDVWGTYDIKPDNTYGGESYIPIDFKTLPNAQLDPITTTSWNLGYELGLFNNRISLDVDAYYRQIDNQLSTIATPDHSGFEEMKSTETSLVNYGLEFSLTGRPLPLQSDWDLTCNLNFAINRDVVTKLPNEARQILNQKANIANKLGMNTTSLLMYINKGVYATDADVPVDPATGKRLRVGGNDTQDAYFKAGDPIWVDMNGDYIIDEKDKVIAGNIRPKVTGGFWINLSYKNFSVHTNASFVLRRDIVNKVLADNLAAYTSPLKKKIDELREKAALVPIDSYNFWTKEDPYNAVYPNPFDYTHANVIKPFRDDQTLFIEDGSYFKINTVSLSYRFPKPWLDFFRLRSVVLKASVNNIYTFSGYSGISPESVNGLGRDNSGGYPNSRTWTVGVTIGL